MQLDQKRKPSVVVGHPVAKWYQDGHYFNGSGQLLRAVGAGQEGEVEFVLASPQHAAMLAEAAGDQGNDNGGMPTAAELALRAENQQLRERLEALEKAVLGTGGPQHVGTAPPKATQHDSQTGQAKDVTPPPPSDPPPPAQQPTQPPAPSSDPPPADPKAQLEAMPAAKLKKLVLDNNGPEDMTKGPGAKARMIDWLLANVN